MRMWCVWPVPAAARSPTCMQHSSACCGQVSNATTVHVRKPGNSRKWRAHVLCEGKVCDLALLSVSSQDFWADDLMPLQFVDIPELQVSTRQARCPAWPALRQQ